MIAGAASGGNGVRVYFEGYEKVTRFDPTRNHPYLNASA